MNRLGELSKMTWRQRCLELWYWWCALRGEGNNRSLVKYLRANFWIDLVMTGLWAWLGVGTTGWIAGLYWTTFGASALTTLIGLMGAVVRRDAAEREAAREYRERDAIRRSNERWPGSVDGYLNKIADEQAGVRKTWQ